MIPEPKKAARFIRRKLLMSKEERLEERELERDLKIRESKTRIRRNVIKQQELRQRMMGLAKKALRLSDENRFRQLGKQIVWSEKQIERWEKYLLTVEMLEAHRDQVRASSQMLHAIKAVSDSFEEFVSPDQITVLQKDLQRGLSKANNMEEKVEIMMEMMDDVLDSGVPVGGTEVDSLKEEITDSIINEEEARFHPSIDIELERIRKELEKID